MKAWDWVDAALLAFIIVGAVAEIVRANIALLCEEPWSIFKIRAVVYLIAWALFLPPFIYRLATLQAFAPIGWTP